MDHQKKLLKNILLAQLRGNEMKVREIIENNEKWIPNKDYNKSEPEVTVILPTFRRAQNGYFENAVLSVIKQLYTNWELIIVDDASTDGTEELIQEFMNMDPRINCIRHINNVGLPAISEYEAYRKGRGAYFAFLFDDNVWEKEFLYKSLIMMKRLSVKASYGVARGYANIENNDYVELGKADAFGVANLAMHNFIANGSVILHRDVIENVGLYDPHLTLTRLCDWDLWRRICRKYEFLQTNIWATSEMGVCLNDSLGNSYMMNYWCALERMAEARDEELRPGEYENVDIVEIKENNTSYYHDTIKILLNQFNKKSWFSDKHNINKVKDEIKKKKRIVVVHDGMSASITLYMERLFQQTDDFVVKYFYGSVNKNDLILADALITTRSVILNEFLVEWCNKLNIPAYYFVDDNFVEMSKENQDDIDIVRVAKSTNRTILRKYNGVIVSTPALKKYFENSLIHNKILLMEPLVDIEKVETFELNSCKEELNIGFLGGGWRSESFIKYVMPAIKRLTKDTKIVICMPVNSADPSEKKKYMDFADNNLVIEFIEKTLSLDAILQRAKKKSIDILVHCGESNINNEFKSENALINAVQIGAVLVVSEDQPYVTSPVANEAFLLAENTIDDWYMKLKILRENKKRIELYNRAKEYCLKRYSNNEDNQDFIKQIFETSNADYYDYFERASMLVNSSRTPNVVIGSEKSFRNVRLGLASLINREISYNFTCSVNDLRELGVLFGSYELSCNGRVKISIMITSKVLFEQWFPISFFVRDDWTYIDLGIIPNMNGKILTVKFECEYDKGSAKIGFFEDLDKRTFWYKVFNKLGHHINGIDALVTDCR